MESVRREEPQPYPCNILAQGGASVPHAAATIHGNDDPLHIHHHLDDDAVDMQISDRAPRNLENLRLASVISTIANDATFCHTRTISEHSVHHVAAPTRRPRSAALHIAPYFSHVVWAYVKLDLLDTSLPAPKKTCFTESEGAQGKATRGVPTQVSAHPATPAAAAATNACAAATFPRPSTLAPIPYDDRGRIRKLDLPAPWKEPNTRSKKRVAQHYATGERALSTHGSARPTTAAATASPHLSPVSPRSFR
jgi:hypothetical protein